MLKDRRPGVPIPTSPDPPELIITEAGDYAASHGVRVMLSGTDLIFLASFDGNDVALGVDIHKVLEAIGEFTRRTES